MPPSLTRQEAERLVNTYADLILRLSYTYLSHTHDAQDICQTVFLKLIERRPAFASSEHEKAWIIRTTINACKDHLKSHWRKTTVPIAAARHVPAPAAEPPLRTKSAKTARRAVSAGGARCGDAKQRRACGPGPAPCRVQPHPAKTDRTREAIR